MMTRTIKILTLLAVMAITAGQAWAEAPTYGKIHYTQGGTDGGRLSFSTTLDMTYNAQTDFNGSAVESGNDRINTYTVTGKTLTDGKVYVRALPSFGYTVTGMTITVEPSAPSSTAEAPRRGAPTVGSTIPVTPVEGHSGVYTFPMPTDGTNVTVTASFPVSTPIDVDYLDATGAKQTAQAYVLDGAELYLGNSDQKIWYVCNSAIDYRTQLRLYGDVRLILADGAEMGINLNSDQAAITYGNDEIVTTLSIYAQSTGSGMGILNAKSTNSNLMNCDGIRAYSITINGGNVSTTGYRYGLNTIGNTDATGDVTINGGIVTARTMYDIAAINASNKVIVNGGQVKAVKGEGTDEVPFTIKGNKGITLGWTNANDFIKASSYSVNNGAVKTAAGKRFIAYNMTNDDDISANCIIGSATGETTLNNTELNNIAGKTLRPLDGYYVKDDNTDLAFSGKTAPDFIISNIPYYIYKANDDVTLTTADYGQNGIEFDANYDIADATGAGVQAKTFGMPAQDVSINSVKYYNTAVDYLDWDDTEKKLVSKTTDDNTKVYILIGGGETTLPGGWYVVNNWNKDTEDGTDADYTGHLTFTGDANLILADDAEMIVYNSYRYNFGGESPITYESAIYGKDYNLSFYGQGGKDIEGNSIEGKLIVNPSIHGESNMVVACLYIKDIFINGGIINVAVNLYDAEGKENMVLSGIKCNNSTIRGGHVEINSCDDEINASQSIIILGGQTETRRIHANNDITLSLTDGSDYIKASSYSANGSVKIPAGKALIIDGTTTILGGETETTIADLTTINGKTLRPSKNFPVAAGEQYDGIYQELGTWKNTDPDTKSYLPTGNILQDGNGNYAMEVEEVKGEAAGTIPNGTPIIVGNVNGLPANINMIGTSQAEANDIENGYAATEDAIEQEHQQEHTEPVITMLGTNTTETLEKQIARAVGTTAEIARADYMVLGFEKGKIRPIKVTLNNVPGSKKPLFAIKKLHALHMIRGTYNVTASNAPARGIPFDFGEDETMGISSLTPTLSEGEGVWYTIDGRKISGKPAQKGMYINQGKKVVIR